MKRNKSKKPKGNFKRILAKYYVGSIIAVIITVILVVYIGAVLIDKVVAPNLSNNLANYTTDIYNDFTKVKYEDILNKNSYVVVLDSHNKQVFTKSIDMEKEPIIPQFSDKQISYIPNLGEDISVSKVNYDGDNFYYSVRKNDFQYIFDTDYNMIFPAKNPPTKLTEYEYKLFTGDYDENISMYKYQFEAKDGNNYTMIVYQSFAFFLKEFDKITSIMMGLFILFIILFLAFAVIFVLIVNRKVQRPLGLINEVFIDYANGLPTQKNKYREMREFADIFGSFDKMADKLNKSESQKKEMIADISHDLKTPITVIQGYSKALSDGIIPDSEREKYLSAISSKADELDSLINMFHDYSKIDHPNYMMKYENSDIFNFTRDYLAEKYSDIELKGFNIDVDIPDSSVICAIDRSQLKRAYDNIIDNSLKYNASGTTIYAYARQVGANIIVRLSDDGVGIPEEAGQSVFEPFTKLEKARTNKGSGLGLSISKKIVEMHGGTLKLIKGQRQGACFEITIPIKTL